MIYIKEPYEGLSNVFFELYKGITWFLKRSILGLYKGLSKGQFILAFQSFGSQGMQHKDSGRVSSKGARSRNPMY